MLLEPSWNINDDVFPSVECKTSALKNVNTYSCVAYQQFKIIFIVCTPNPEINLGNSAYEWNLIFLSFRILWINFEPVVSLAVKGSFYTKNLSTFFSISSTMLSTSAKISAFLSSTFGSSFTLGSDFSSTSRCFTTGVSFS